VRRMILALGLACVVGTGLQAQMVGTGAPVVVVPSLPTSCPSGYNLGCVLETWTTPASNVGTTETTLATYTLPANTLSALGQKLHLVAWGSFAANADSKTIASYFGATKISTYGGSFNGIAWRIDATVQVAASGQSGTAMSLTNGNTPAILTSSPAETLTGTVVVKVTGTSGTGSGDVTLDGAYLEWLPAGGLN